MKKQYLKTLVGCMGALKDKFVDLGHFINGLQGEATGDEIKEVLDWLMDRGLNKADIEAACRCAKGEIRKELFFDGIANSKLLTLSLEEQDRLLSGKPLEVINPEAPKAPPEKKPYKEMTNLEKDLVLGPKGGGIRDAKKQAEYVATPHGRPKGSGGRMTLYEFDDARVEGDKVVFSVKGQDIGTIATAILALMQIGKKGKKVA